jgi:hypothetical protein
MKTLLVLVAAAAASAVLAGAGAGSGDATQPSLRLVDRAPLRVAGSNFRSRELVRVTARALTRETDTVRATAAGRIVVAFEDVSLEPCDAATVVALGARSSRASLTVAPRLCPPPP